MGKINTIEGGVCSFSKELGIRVPSETFSILEEILKYMTFKIRK
jgi:hypothetical protein